MGRYLSLKSMFIAYMSKVSIFGYLWLITYAIVFMNVALILVYGLYSRLVKKQEFRRIFLKEIPKTAIIYTIRSEGSGLFERFDYSLSNNSIENVDLWILSGATTNDYTAYENQVVERLKNKYGNNRVKYFHTEDPKVKKPQIIKLWLSQYEAQYKYFMICDADSLLPENTILRLLQYAEHSANKDVSIYQTCLCGVNAKTYYSKYLCGGTVRMMMTEVPVNQRVLGQILYFGHNALIRTKDFKDIEIEDGILSHDIWDSVYLDIRGKKAIFCHNIVTYEEQPASFIEDMKRIGRWARGNIQTIPLIFKPGISIGTRFLIFYGIYTYLVQPIFLIWLATGLGITHQQVWRGLSGLSWRSYTRMLTVLFVLFFHQVLASHNTKIKKIITNIMLSMVIMINTIFYNALYILQMPFRKGTWNPMKKNPNVSITFIEAVKTLWPGTLLGVLLLYISIYLPYWFMMSFPIVLGLVFSIPIIYYTGKVKENL